MIKSFGSVTDEKVKLCGYYIDEIESNMSERDFQREFFDSLSDQYNNGRNLSDKQILSLKKMYERVTS